MLETFLYYVRSHALSLWLYGTLKRQAPGFSRVDREHGAVWGRAGRLHGPSKEDQMKLISILSRASILRISKQCRFPAWLGYLGLGLSYTEPVESEVKRLSASWKPQLLKLLPSHTNMMHLLKLTLFDSDESQLRWQDLERVEEALIIRNNWR